MRAAPLAPGLVPGETWDATEERPCTRCTCPAWKHSENDGVCYGVYLPDRTRCTCPRYVPPS